jgi:hypothetical protein
MMTRLIFAAVVFAASVGVALAQEAPADVAPYCSGLRMLNNFAMSRERFSSIIGKPRDGNFRDTTLSLTGWNNCSIYGQTTYTCDSPELKTAADAVAAQSRIAREILACFGGTWSAAPEQTSPGFLVLHPKLGPASITLSLDQTDAMGHIVRLILFIRRG